MKLYIIIILALLTTSCVHILPPSQTVITSTPSGAIVYVGHQKHNMQNTQRTTPYIEDKIYASPYWDAMYFQVKKSGYHDSNIIYQAKHLGHRQIHFELTPLPTVLPISNPINIEERQHIPSPVQKIVQEEAIISPEEIAAKPEESKTQKAESTIEKSSEKFSKKYNCSELTSSEAEDLLNKGHHYLDHDSDGVPCEKNQAHSNLNKTKPPKEKTYKPKTYVGCPCSSSQNCVGPRGGSYCITSGGNKRYR